MIEDLYEETRNRMEKTIDALKHELSRVRTGRASLSLLDGIRVDYYGTPTPLNQMASLSIPESRLIVIQPWDVSVVKEIEKGTAQERSRPDPLLRRQGGAHRHSAAHRGAAQATCQAGLQDERGLQGRGAQHPA